MPIINMKGLNLIKDFEGLETDAYRDRAGVLTIGYGETKNVKENDSITEQHATAMLDKRLREFEQYIDDLVSVPLNANQNSALVSLIYNIGPSAFSKSTLLQKLNEGKYDEVPYQMKRWNKATVNGQLTELQGLTRRRQAEADLFSEKV